MDTPDIASIVSMIISNPGLVEQISGMVKGDSKVETEPMEETDTRVRSDSEERAPLPPINEKRLHRTKLANAMKPYLSEPRQKAIDAMLSIADIIDITRENK